MAAVANLSDLTNLLSSSACQRVVQYKDARVGAAAAATAVTSRLISLWQFNAAPMGKGATPPSSATVLTRTSPGALGQANAASGKELWLASMAAAATANGSLELYDRLASFGGLSGTVTTAQATTGLDLDTLSGARYNGATDSIGNRIFIEIDTAIGTTATTLTVSYDNENGVTKTSQVTPVGGSGLREAQRIFPVPFADGDLGIRKVNSVTLAGTTGTAGNFAVVIGRPLQLLPVTANVATARDCFTGVPSVSKILDDACLALIFFSQGTTTPAYVSEFVFVEK